MECGAAPAKVLIVNGDCGIIFVNGSQLGILLFAVLQHIVVCNGVHSYIVAPVAAVGGAGTVFPGGYPQLIQLTAALVVCIVEGTTRHELFDGFLIHNADDQLVVGKLLFFVVIHTAASFR